MLVPRCGGENRELEGIPPCLFLAMFRIGAMAKHRNNMPAAFTLIEAMVSISIAAISGSVLLLGVTSSLQTTSEAMERTIADGMARQLMDEVVGCRYMEPGVEFLDNTLGPEVGETSRDDFDDIDDYDGLRVQPPADRYGISLGADDGSGGVRHANFQATEDFFDDWREEVDVYYVDESNLTTRLTSREKYLAIEVRIVKDDPDGGSRELANLRRVVVYVPAM